MIKQCLIFFGGVANEGSGQFSYQAGIRPSRATIHTRLGVYYPQIGTLRVTDGQQYRDFPGCRVVRHTIKSQGGGGRMRELVIEDRRWAWGESRIWGEYNTVDQGGRSTAGQRSARELASLCLDAMGETGYDVSALPPYSYPEVSWDADVAAEALDSICQMFGCLVVLQTRTNQVRIWKDNTGSRPAIDSRAMDATPSSEPKVVPPVLIFEGGRTLWQRDLMLEPVGIEKAALKSIIVPIDSLSYKPTDGWEVQDPRVMQGVAKDYRELAKSCVYRMFRVKPPFVFTPPPSGLTTSGKDSLKTAGEVAEFFTVKANELWRILPLESHQVSSLAGFDQAKVRDALLVGAFVEGKSVRANNVDKGDYNFTDPNVQLPEEENNPFADVLVYMDGFNLDAASGIVTTSRPVYYREDSKCKAPYLRLRTAFGLRHRETKQFVSQQFRYRPPSPTSGAYVPELIKQSDVVFEIVEGRRDLAPNAPTPGAFGFVSINNAGQFISLAQAYLVERLASYYPDEALSVPYKGFVFDYEIDGAIRSVSWATGPQGGATVVDYSIERPEMRITHSELRDQAAQSLLAKNTAAAAKRTRAILRKPAPISRIT